MERGGEDAYQQNLYGAYLFLDERHDPQTVETYIAVQEKTHLAEGLKLRQRSPRTHEYVGSHVLGFGGQPMVEANRTGYRVAKRQYLAGDEAAWCLIVRCGHDVAMSEYGDELMADGEVGDGFMVVSPYEEEQPPEVARRLGFWPETRRSYAWFYRKVSKSEFECVDVSIGQSSVATYKQLLQEQGLEIPDEAQSHDIPGYFVPFHAASGEARDVIIDNVLERYSQLNNDPNAKEAMNTFEAIEFLDTYAKDYLKLMVDVHRAVAETLKTGTLQDLVRLSATRALKTLSCLDYGETAALRELLYCQTVTVEQEFALSTLIAAQRYGIWDAMSEMVEDGAELNPEASSSYVPVGIAVPLQTVRLLDYIYGHTNQAAAEMKTMPGCSGGTSFLQQNEEDVKSSIFSKDEKGVMRCVNCPKCRTFHDKLRASEGKFTCRNKKCGYQVKA